MIDRPIHTGSLCQTTLEGVHEVREAQSDYHKADRSLLYSRAFHIYVGGNQQNIDVVHITIIGILNWPLPYIYCSHDQKLTALSTSLSRALYHEARILRPLLLECDPLIAGPLQASISRNQVHNPQLDTRKVKNRGSISQCKTHEDTAQLRGSMA